MSSKASTPSSLAFGDDGASEATSNGIQSSVAPTPVHADICVPADVICHADPDQDALATTLTRSTVHRPTSAGSKCPAAFGGIQRPTSARAASSSRLKMWAKTPREKSQQDKQEALEQFNLELNDTLLDVKLDGLERRQAAEELQRSRRHSITGEAWKVGGACAGTVRSASLSRVRGGTTSGLFSDFQPLEGSESFAALHERCTEKRDTRPGKQRRQAAESASKSRRHSKSGEPWRAGGACAGTVRAASLSRTRGTTVSGLFSDVQPLAGSESAALMQEKMKLRQRRRERLRSSKVSTDFSGSVSRSSSVPSLVLPQTSTPKAAHLSHNGNSLGRAKGSEQDADLMLFDEGASCDTPKFLPAGSALASVRCARRSAVGGA